MAKIKTYRTVMSIPGLPDTTNVKDAQLRLYLDRLNGIFSKLVSTVNSIDNNVDIKSILAALLKDPEFLDFIQKEATKIAKTEADKAIDKNEKIKRFKNKVLEYITVIPAGLNIKPGEAYEALEVVYYPDDILNYQRGVTWSSSDETIATVDENGKVTTYANGQCVITATSTYNTNITADCYVFVAEEYTIFINAVYEWISIEGFSVYTEKSFPIVNDTVWNTNAEITVTVPADMTEEEAKIQASGEIISDTDERRFIVTEESKRYWRDTEKDVSKDEYEIINVPWFAHVCGTFDTSKSDIPFYATLWDENEEWIGVKELFSNAYRADKLGDPANATEAQKEEYSRQNCLVAKQKIPFEKRKRFLIMTSYKTWDGTGSDDPWEKEWTEHYTGDWVYMVATGETVTLTYYNVGDGDKVTETYLEITTYDGKFPCWINKHEWDGDEYASGGQIGCSIYKPYVAINPEDGTEYIHSGIDRDADARVINRRSEYAFEFDNIWYEFTGKIYINPYVFDIEKCFAWSLSPVVGDETVYTVGEEAPDKYGTLNENNTFEEKGKVADTGNGVYSITVNDETVYYSAEHGV